MLLPAVLAQVLREFSPCAAGSRRGAGSAESAPSGSRLSGALGVGLFAGREGRGRRAALTQLLITVMDVAFTIVGEQ